MLALPFFSTLATKGLLEYPLFALSLSRNSTGTLTLGKSSHSVRFIRLLKAVSVGAIDASIVEYPGNISWNKVAQFPPFGAENSTARYLQWAIPISGIAVSLHSFQDGRDFNEIPRSTALNMCQLQPMQIRVGIVR